MNTEELCTKAVEIFFTTEQDITPLIEMGMNKNSAKDTIRCYSQLIVGKPFSRGMQQGVFKPLLKYLYEHNDRENLNNVLIGLDRHFAIRLEKYNQKNIGAREIVDGYKKKLALMDNDREISYPDEVDEEMKESLKEGAKKQVVVNAYERNPEARRQCLYHYGFDCKVCGINFENMYGKIGRNFIHVHHLKQISDIKEEYEIDPLEDLLPVCPNCHAMLHKLDDPSDISGLKEMLRK